MDEVVRVPSVYVGFVVALIPGWAPAQRCADAHLFYIVRGEDGVPLRQSELEVVREQSPLPVGMGDIDVSIDALSKTADGSYVNPREGPTTAVVSLLHLDDRSDECLLRLTEFTLVHRQRRMRLIFHRDDSPFLPTSRESLSPPLQSEFQTYPNFVVVDSLPFQEGTFELDFEGWLRDFLLTWPRITGVPGVSPQYWSRASE